jgi:cobalt transporter subunit CbtA
MEIFRRVIFAATLAGLGAGLTVTLLHQALTVPLILQAETFEQIDADSAAAAAVWHPQSTWERAVATAITDGLTGIGFALVLIAIWRWRADVPDWRRGAAWGCGGFLATVVAPSIGLPAELPGTVAAALPARQIWWMATVGVTAVGLGVACLAHRPWVRGCGLASLVLPHLIGAPQPLDLATALPAELRRTFQVAVYLCSFQFWLVLGVLASIFHRQSMR